MNNILEAIQKGVQMGLEIQDDELDQSIFQRSEVTSDYHTNRADQIRFVRDNFVDLGLPSGTLWCKWNLGATNGSTEESWCGDYYAWGEVETKENFEWETYKHCNGTDFSITKYNRKDNIITLDPEDDVVSVTLGKEFKMPTKEDFEELCSLPSQWVKKYNGVRGLNGRIFTGTNGNTLFIPASGYRNRSSLYYVGSQCFLWSSSRNPVYHTNAYYMLLRSDDITPYDDYLRCRGRSVRAILKTQ